MVGVARREETARRAEAARACHYAGTEAALLAGCDFVVLCTPVDVMPQWMSRIAEVAPKALVTDCGSTKQWVVEQAARYLGPQRFLGGHPMAGKESSGFDAAEAALFAGCVWVLTPNPGVDLDAFAPWIAAVRELGARPVLLEPAVHDTAVAWVSHLPFVLSAALVRAAGGDPSWPIAGRLAAGGFRDLSRLAGGDAAMYAAIVRTNDAALRRALDGCEAQLAQLRRLLDDGGDVCGWFAEAASVRRLWLAQRGADAPGAMGSP